MGKRTELEALRTAIDEVGGQQRLADLVSRLSGDALGQSAISNWVIRGRVPAERVLAVEKACKGVVSRHDLRPDIYPRQVA